MAETHRAGCAGRVACRSGGGPPLNLRAGAQPSSVGQEPVCAADAAVTAAARAQEETKALETIYGTGLEALAPGGARLCVTAAEMAAEAEQVLQGAPCILSEGAQEGAGSPLVDGSCEPTPADCGELAPGCGAQPDGGA